MAAAVCDSSPLIYLARLGAFEWLRSLHGWVLLPEAVWEEVAVQGEGRLESDALRLAVRAGWARVVKVDAGRRLPRPSGLHRGEMEALELAFRENLLLVMDERVGRDFAKQLGIRVVGTAGLLLAAKTAGLTEAVRPHLDRLAESTNFRLARPIRAQLLRMAGESEGKK